MLLLSHLRAKPDRREQERARPLVAGGLTLQRAHTQMRLHATHAIAQDFISTTRAILRRHSTADVQYYLTQSDSDVCVRATSRCAAPVLSYLVVFSSDPFCLRAGPQLVGFGFQRLRYDVAATCFRLFPSVILVTIGTLLVVVAVVSQDTARTLGYSCLR